MQFLISRSTNPCINLATEEFLLKSTSDNIIFLYQNDSCCIVGKHQNAMAETNHRFVTEKGIPVIRRISGGGTVYHDAGNLNFTFIQNGEEGKLVNFRSYIEPITEFLKQLGIPAEIGIRNDILVNGLKVSGNAEHIYKKRTLHHGTLLFSSNLAYLRGALKTEPGKYTDRAVKSVRSSVANLDNYINGELDFSQFLNQLEEYLLRKFEPQVIELNPEITSVIHQQALDKYQDWNWNYGYSPAYTFQNNIKTEEIELSIVLNIEKGIIQEAYVDGPGILKLAQELQLTLPGIPHSFESLSGLEIIKQASVIHKDFIWFFF